MTKKQKEEIEFLANYHGIAPTAEEQEEYLAHTVHGKKESIPFGTSDTNPLFQAKRSLDMMIKIWREDLTNGLLSKDELLADYGEYPYFVKLLEAILKSVTREYRYKILSKENPNPLRLKRGTGNYPLAIINFDIEI